MKKNNNNLKIFPIILLLIFFQSCNSQTTENVQFIGQENKTFDLDKVTFKENAGTIFSKIAHVKIEKTGENNKIFHVYRVKVSDQKDNLFNYFNINAGDVEVFADQNNDIVLFSGMKQMKKNEANIFFNQLRDKYKEKEIVAKKNQFIDDTFIAIINNKLIYTTMTCFKEGDFKGECNIIYKLYRYPQKDNDVIRLMTPVSDVENLLKK